VKRDIEHVVTSTAMFVIAFIVSSNTEPAKVVPLRRRGSGAPSLISFVGIALLLGAFVWTMNVYMGHVAFCAHLRLQAPPTPSIRPDMPPPPSLEYIDLSALGIEGILLTAFAFFAIRTFRRRRLSR
jgi:hypothetical protein